MSFWKHNLIKIFKEIFELRKNGFLEKIKQVKKSITFNVKILIALV